MTLPAENVQSYPRPPTLEPVTHEIRVELGDAPVAQSSAALRVLETHHAPTYYIPPEDVVADLSAAPGGSFCEWKGHAAYWTVHAGGISAQAAAWSYARPTPRFAALAGYLAFYPGLMGACWVGGVRVTPQPGDFYGGWVTPNLQGIVKGDAATRHW
ncbi:DUF427 domain-containing protein [uncultured Tateyamaria sp.]|uniref:DUF427 domain-containing protein n=1 Tax=Tateyamaria sp. 1078 TaxID=3417464 RepID=UPI00260206DC|nr:DUF427 domain-containing protein [uncultured Tateyamaria sp.]